ncbi:MAG: hypothetical protein LBT24_05230 [Tannerella sp.]|jgi:hypothetical protein|nr:hypothetical protein [Tannerella sp.]
MLLLHFFEIDTVIFTGYAFTGILFFSALASFQGESNKVSEYIKVGYALSHSSSRDVCIMYCLEKDIHDVEEVNMLLFEIGIEPLTREC